MSDVKPSRANSEPTVKPVSGSTPSVPLPDEAAQADAAARFGKFIRTQKLGAGGMGEVWKAWDTELGRWVALKFLRGGDDEEIARFKREAQTAGRLSHPHIAAIYEVGESHGRHYIAMQYIEGRTLRALAEVERRTIVALIRDTALALQFAHERGVVHRDIKPDNLMVSGQHVYVMDFGLARPLEGASNLSLSGMIVGTPSYMSPEQARGERVDARADVYSLGTTLYELLTGTVPFQGANILETLRKIQDDDPRPPRAVVPEIEADLETIVLKCLDKERQRRYTTAGELAADLDRWLAGEPVSVRGVSPLYRVKKKLWKRRAIVAVAVLGLLAVAAVIIHQGVRGAARERARVHLDAGRRTLDSMKLRSRSPAASWDELALMARRAEGEFRNALREVPDEPEAELGIGRAWALAGDDAKALVAVDRSVAICPLFAPALLERARLRLGEYERLRNLHTEESEQARRVREAVARDVTAAKDVAHDASERQYAEGMLAFATRDYSKADQLLGTYLAALPEDGNAWYFRARAAFNIGRQADAEGFIDKAVECGAGAVETLFARGQLKAARKDYEGAIADFDAALRKMNGPAPVVYLHRGLAKQQKGDFDGAIADYTQAIQQTPENGLAVYNRAAARFMKVDYAGAKEDYDEVLRRFPRQYDAWIGRAVVRRKLNDLNGAVADYSEAIRLRPPDPVTYLWRAQVWLDKQDKANAIADLKSALQLAPPGWEHHAAAERELSQLQH